jgi:putative transposase
VVSLAAKRCAAEYLQEVYSVSERRACVVLSLHRSSARRKPGHDQRCGLVARIHALSERYPRFGYRKLYHLLKTEDARVSRERVRLIRKQEGLQVVKKPRKRRPLGVSTALPTRAEYPNHVWSYDFLHDETTDGRRLKCLTLLDEYTREGLAIYCARSITANDVVRVLDALFSQRGAPACLKSDNGPELMAKQVTAWLKERRVKTHFIDPGSPWQNGHNESFNGVFRDGCLNRWVFYSVTEAQRVIAQWLDEYNHERPHGSLNGMTPAAFAALHQKSMKKAA